MINLEIEIHPISEDLRCIIDVWYVRFQMIRNELRGGLMELGMKDDEIKIYMAYIE